ncbi:hypothetical protein U8Q06_20890 [Rhizobium beringeri]|uniref:hypothetical protein n=1 Tax=Rhizobium beringeri TaxID=3019934 RepID=UPI002E0D6D8A|nr:hypothetical protein U8Q06_20890 [Rhizobium beringeri]
MLEVIAAEIDHQRRCVLSLTQIAARASVSRSTTSLAIRKARKAGDLIVRWRQNEGLCNVIVAKQADQ